jgi:hypothetical protein
MGAMNTAVQDLKDFLHSPFRGNMDIFSVFLAIGLVIVCILLWTRILSHIEH